MSEERERYPLIDGIRGIAIISMVAFHFCFDVFVICRGDFSWPALPWIRLWQRSICWTFLIVSGMVWSWGRAGNLRRGIRLNLLGLLVSLVTWIAVPEEAIWFGILNFIGCAILLMIPLDRVAGRIPPLPGILACLALFFLFENAQLGYLGFGSIALLKLPRVLYTCRVLTPLGFPSPGFYSGDYFPIIPWMFLYLAGYFFQKIFIKKDAWKRISRHPLPLLAAIGRKSIWIYMLHQPLCMLLCEIIF